VRKASGTAPLYGLVLVGGKSRRMGRDKAALAYHGGVPQARRTAALRAEVCERVFL
jgi:molybdopterin-guanine dinucleotide biosynthesis protein A